MKYTLDIEIDIPLDKIKELFDSEENLYKWQPSLKSHEHLGGTKGQAGAKTKLSYQSGKRKLDMVETIVKNDLPRQFDCTYEAKGVLNMASNEFKALSENQTKWIMKNEFQFSGFMKLMSLFMKSAFPKETKKSMLLFKQFAESEN